MTFWMSHDDNIGIDRNKIPSPNTWSLYLPAIHLSLPSLIHVCTSRLRHQVYKHHKTPINILSKTKFSLLLTFPNMRLCKPRLLRLPWHCNRETRGSPCTGLEKHAGHSFASQSARQVISTFEHQLKIVSFLMDSIDVELLKLSDTQNMKGKTMLSWWRQTSQR